MLEGASSQKPMSFNLLIGKSGLMPATLNMILDNLYASHVINQAIVTRGGVAQREVWPTGVTTVITYFDNKHRFPPTPPPRRDENKPKKLEVNMNSDLQGLDAADITPVDTLLAQAAEQKPRALRILEYIESHPGCTLPQIQKVTNIKAPRAYINNHIKNKKLLMTVNYGAHNTYKIADGFSANSIYGQGVKNNGHAVGSHVKKAKLQACCPAAAPKYDADLGLYPVEKIASKPTLQEHIDALFMLLPESASIVISRNQAQLEIDIEADVFGKSVSKNVTVQQVKQTLDALHIVTVEMA